MSSKTPNIKSFSILELMIVLTILAVLAVAGIPNYLIYLQRAAVTEAVSVLAQFKTDLGLFWSIEERLPEAGDTLNGSIADLPFGVEVDNLPDAPLPDSIESLTLSASGNGIIITAVLQGNAFSSIAVNNRTLTLGALPFGTQLQFQCGNFTTNATAITDIGFTNISVLPNGCNYNGIGTWIAS